MLLNESYMMNDRIVLGFVIVAGWAFVGIGLSEEDDELTIIDELLFYYANITVVAATIYLIYTWFTRWTM